MPLRALSVLLLAAVVCVPAWGAQAPQLRSNQPAVLQGRVIQSEGQPLFRARVEHDAGRARSAPVFTDQEGRFQISAVTETAWRLRISKPGFVGQVLDERELAKRLGSGTPLAIVLERGAVVAGQVVDETGEPVVGAAVRIRYLGGARSPQANATPERFTDTDDRGAFRVGGLPAGDVEVSVPRVLADGETVSSDALAVPPPPTGSLTASPVRATLRSGEEIFVAVGVGLTSIGNASARERAPAARKGNATIAGRITGPDGRPVSQATVQAVPLDDGPPASARSDGQGRYEITGLAAGSFRVRVSRQGYPPVQYGQSRALQSGRAISMRAGQRTGNIDVTLTRGGVVTGRIVDAAGEPVEGVQMQAWEARVCSGRTVVSASASNNRDRLSDDRGEFRLYGLLPAMYFVTAVEHATPNGSRRDDGAPIPVYFPGRTNVAEATTIQVSGFDDLGLADLIFDPISGTRVSGLATDSAGRPLAGSAMLTTSLRSGAPLTQPKVVSIRPDGSFEFAAVAPGDYVVQALGPPARGRSGREFGVQFVTVTGIDAPRITVTTSAGSEVSGRIRLEGDSRGVTPNEFGVTLSASDLDLSPMLGEATPRWRVNDDWTFSFLSVIGVFRVVPTRVPDGWWLKSVPIDGTNAAEEGVAFGTPEASRTDVELVFSRTAAGVSGRVVDRRKRQIADYSVVVFPTDADRWYDGSRYMKLARSDQDGRFAIGGLPPGDYWVAAVDVIDGSSACGDWLNRDVLNALTTIARRVRLAPGQEALLELDLTRAVN
jgi:protocatechuate 3,4-dioxygenase beta subunit